MKYAEDFRRIARNALKGKWTIAVVAGLLAALLGGEALGGPQINFKLNDGNFYIGLEFAGQDVLSTGGNSQLWYAFAGMATYIAVFAIVIGVALFILGSVVEVGYARFHLNLVEGKKEPELGDLFAYFSFWRTTACARLLQVVIIFLWSLLLVIPGIIAGYSYAMTEFLLAEDPQLTASEAMRRSKEMMTGNRWRLFCLQFSFIGWEILSALLTFGIGRLWIAPYRQAATAAFYREISGRRNPETFNS